MLPTVMKIHAWIGVGEGWGTGHRGPSGFIGAREKKARNIFDPAGPFPVPIRPCLKTHIASMIVVR